MGAASLFSDARHEMATSVLPTFLTSTLHAGPAALGVIEGVSDALTGLSKLATTLLILRATNLLTADGRSLTAATSIAILLYAAHNGAATLASLGGGHLSDHFSPRGVIAAGAAVYVLG